MEKEHRQHKRNTSEEELENIFWWNYQKPWLKARRENEIRYPLQTSMRCQEIEKGKKIDRQSSSQKPGSISRRPTVWRKIQSKLRERRRIVWRNFGCRPNHVQLVYANRPRWRVETTRFTLRIYTHRHNGKMMELLGVFFLFPCLHFFMNEWKRHVRTRNVNVSIKKRAQLRLWPFRRIQIAFRVSTVLTYSHTHTQRPNNKKWRCNRNSIRTRISQQQQQRSVYTNITSWLYTFFFARRDWSFIWISTVSVCQKTFRVSFFGWNKVNRQVISFLDVSRLISLSFSTSRQKKNFDNYIFLNK